MRKKLYSIIVIVAVFLNLISPKVFAQVASYEEASPIYNVVVPTSYRFTVDPNRFLDEDSMIASPEYYVINKSSVPIEMDISFRLMTKEGIMLDVKNSRNDVGNIPARNDIWIAAVFNSKIVKAVTEDKILTTTQGETVYQYIDGSDVVYSTSPNLVLKKTIKVILSEEEMIKKPAVVVASGGAITSDGEDTQIPIVPVESNGADTASGGAITIDNEAVSIPNIPVEIKEDADAASGGAIIANDEAGPIAENPVEIYVLAVASGGAISMNEEEATIPEKPQEVNGITDAVSGGAITQNPEEQIIPDENVKSGINKPQADGNTGVSDDNDLLKEKITYNYQEVQGIPVIYKDTKKVFGNYGDIAQLDENSPNVLPMNYDWSTKSIVLDRSEVYSLMGNTVVTGAAANDNRGVSTFRFVGTVNTNTKWSETELRATIQITFSEYKDNSIVVNDQGEIEATDIDNVNITEDAINLNVSDNDSQDDIVKTEYILPNEMRSEDMSSEVITSEEINPKQIDESNEAVSNSG